MSISRHSCCTQGWHGKSNEESSIEIAAVQGQYDLVGIHVDDRIAVDYRPIVTIEVQIIRDTIVPPVRGPRHDE